MTQVFSYFSHSFFLFFLGYIFLKNVRDIPNIFVIITTTKFQVGECMRCFKNIAQLIRTKRLQHPKGYSQSELSHLLGYKNGQFISNVERALCNIPLKMLSRVSEVLDIDSKDLKNAILKDHEETLNNYLNVSVKKGEVKSLHSDEEKQGNSFDGDSYRLSSNS
jgi:transcriptional regulator with XRE-family HTH domain